MRSTWTPLHAENSRVVGLDAPSISHYFLSGGTVSGLLVLDSLDVSHPPALLQWGSCLARCRTIKSSLHLSSSMSRKNIKLGIQQETRAYPGFNHLACKPPDTFDGWSYVD
ncbi:hypothetical protein RRG08_007664 [Elysia crispata]|uniref:Uncharacterized protein n=1 Tax=Elysia crispata TaxID=231223 RepID=A0AAE0Y481_9GAST|nr:hypothetical protein RRG08_007664 [Elysia crispata]